MAMGESNGSNESVRVTTVLPRGQEQRDDWDQYVEDHPEASSISHLIRLSVKKEMEGLHGGEKGDQSGGTGEEVVERLSEVIEHNQAVMSHLENLQTRMRQVENAVGEDPEILDLKNEVFAVLPSPDEVETYTEQHGHFAEWAGMTLGTEPGDRPDYRELDSAPSGLPEDIAKVVDERQGLVEDALDKLTEDSARVRQTSEGRWVKEV